MSIAKIAHVAKAAQEYNILDETKYRNECIKIEYKELLNKNITMVKAEIILSKKYGTKEKPLSPATVHKILFS